MHKRQKNSTCLWHAVGAHGKTARPSGLQLLCKCCDRNGKQCTGIVTSTELVLFWQTLLALFFVKRERKRVRKVWGSRQEACRVQITTPDRHTSLQFTINYSLNNSHSLGRTAIYERVVKMSSKIIQTLVFDVYVRSFLSAFHWTYSPSEVTRSLPWKYQPYTCFIGVHRPYSLNVGYVLE